MTNKTSPTTSRLIDLQIKLFTQQIVFLLIQPQKNLLSTPSHVVNLLKVHATSLARFHIFTFHTVQLNLPLHRVERHLCHCAHANWEKINCCSKSCVRKRKKEAINNEAGGWTNTFANYLRLFILFSSQLFFLVHLHILHSRLKQQKFTRVNVQLFKRPETR